MAFSGHTSRQLWQVTPCSARQFSPITARHGHGCCGNGNSASDLHAAMQSPQNVHSPRCQSRSGKPPSARTRSCSGHAAMQSLQRVQRSRNSASATAPGGRTSEAGALPRNRARRARLGWVAAGGIAKCLAAQGSVAKSRSRIRTRTRSGRTTPEPAPPSTTKTPSARRRVRQQHSIPPSPSPPATGIAQPAGGASQPCIAPKPLHSDDATDVEACF